MVMTAIGKRGPEQSAQQTRGRLRARRLCVRSVSQDQSFRPTKFRCCSSFEKEKYVPLLLQYILEQKQVPVPSWGYITRDHFCPIVSPSEAAQNRARRAEVCRKKRAGSMFHSGPDVPDHNDPFSRDYVQALKEAYVQRSYYGGPDYTCHYCSAMFWFGEHLRSRSSVAQQRIFYTGCCRDGCVSLPMHRPFPSPLKDLVCFNGSARSNLFMRMIRHYNSMFSFTSIGVHIDNSINTGDGPYVFRINGVVHHRIGSLVPETGRRPEYAQLYIYDTANEVSNRIGIYGTDGQISADPEIVQELIYMLNQHNPLVAKFRLARDRLFSPNAPEIRIKLHGTVNGHGDRYALPAAPELAGLLVGGLSTECNSFDVVVETHSSVLKSISPVHPALMALQYPLLFPYGEVGYHTGIKLKLLDGQSCGGRANVSMTEYYAYYMHYRTNEPNPVLCSGRLSQQYVVNAYSCVESNRLSFFAFNQSFLRTETYQGISDAIGRGASSGKDVGVKKVLPASHIGGKRYMKSNMHDNIAICCAYGPPDKFTTMTCNPNWPEIMEALRFEPGQRPSDRADVVVRVFHMKLDEYLQDIKDGLIFGPVNAAAHTNEFQKRGLLHSHILVWQKKEENEDPIINIDNYISAELPYAATDPLGFALVQEFMVHGPCSVLNPKSPCMKDGRCSKGYPKEFRSETTVDADGYPLYQRRDNGSFVWKNNIKLDNRWIVPHNLDALKKYQCHINVEGCNKTYLIKYLFKYINKGFDCAKIRFQAADSSSASLTSQNPLHEDSEQCQEEGIDEIAEYIKSRYLSWCEAVWRLLGFKIHGKFPAVERLYVHLPGLHFVTLHEQADLQAVIDDPESDKSMLTEWFVANQKSSKGHHLTYCEFPSEYTWYPDKKIWRPRKRGFKLGRIRYVHPTAGETYFLRMLLMIVRGAKSYEDLRTYNGVLYNTFREACQARGLIGDDTEWASLFDEAITWASAHQLRNLFMTVLAYCEVGNVRSLFDRYWKYMADDIVYRMRKFYNNPSYQIDETDLRNTLLRELSDLFSNNGLSIASYDLPAITSKLDSSTSNRLILEEMAYDRSNLQAECNKYCSTLNPDQQEVYNSVIKSVYDGTSVFYFVSGFGGTGKTFLWNAILAKLRSENHIVLAVASCGVASLLLPGGRTAHSRFKIPLDVNEESYCSIPRGGNLASLLIRTSLIIWDEAPMTHRHCFEALDRTLRDIMSIEDINLCNKPFGGKINYPRWRFQAGPTGY